jgi:hypothetical protein
MAEHIKIAGIEPRIQYVGDGITRTFTYPFPAFHAEDVSVYLSNTKQQTGFTVTGIGESYGGAIVFDSPPTSSLLVTIQRETRVERITDFQSGGEFRANALNDELDYQTAVLQEHARDVDRALRLAPNDPTADLVLPPVAERANKLLGFDASGGAIATEAAGGGPGGVTDHGQLTGLSDDDHPQYQTAARADIWFAGKLAGSGSAPTAARSDHTNTAGSVTVATGNPVVNPITSTNAQAAFEELALEMTTHRHDALYAQRNWVPIPKWDATVNPGPNDDIANSYTVGSKWVNLTTDEEFTCVDHTTGAAIWKSTTAQATGGGGGDMLASVYDPAGVGGQIVDTDTPQTLVNKRVQPPGWPAARKIEDRWVERVSVKDFGAVGDGVTNDTAAIQAALNAVRVKGGEIVFPPGDYLHTGLELGTAGVFNEGAIILRSLAPAQEARGPFAREGARLICTSATAVHLKFNDMQRVVLDGLAFTVATGTTPTAGNALWFNGGLRPVVEKCIFDGCFNSILLDKTTKPLVRDVEVRNALGAYGFRIQGTSAAPIHQGQMENIFVSTATAEGSATTDGFQIGDYTNSIHWVNCVSNKNRRGFVIGDTTVSLPAFHRFYACDAENAYEEGWLIQNGTHLWIYDSYSCVNHTHGVRVSPNYAVAGGGPIWFNNCRMSANGRHGAFLQSCPQVHFQGCYFGQNSNPSEPTGGPSNTYDGINVAAAKAFVDILGCRIGGSVLEQADSTGAQRYGIRFEASVTNPRFRIIGNEVSGNTTGAYSDLSASGEKLVVHNAGIPTTAAANPTVNDDVTKGYQINALWTNTATDKVYACVDNTVGAAVWAELTGSGGGGGGDMLASVYDPAGVGGQIVDTDTLQTLVNKRVQPPGWPAPRKIEDRWVERVSVKDFGAVGDGVADDTAAIQAAINALIAANGGELVFPSGTYRYSTLTINTAGQTTKGGIRFRALGQTVSTTAGECGVRLLSTAATGDRITITDAQRVEFDGFAFGMAAGVTPTGGQTIRSIGGNRLVLEKCRFNGTWNSLYIQSTRACLLRNVDMQYVKGDYGFKVEGTSGVPIATLDVDRLFITTTDVFGSGLTDGVLIGPYCSTGNWQGLRINLARRGLVVGEGVTLAAERPYWHWFDDIDVEESTQSNIEIRAGTGIWFTNSYCNLAKENGVWIRPEHATLGGSDIKFTSCLIAANGQNGVLLDSATAVRFANCTIGANSAPDRGGPANTYDGIRTTAIKGHVALVGNRIGGDTTFASDSTGNQRYGVAFTSAVTDPRFQIVGNNLSGNTTGAFNDLSGGTAARKIILGNDDGASLGSVLLDGLSIERQGDAVNRLRITARIAGNSPQIIAEGADTNLNIPLAGKGNGQPTWANAAGVGRIVVLWSRSVNPTSGDDVDDGYRTSHLWHNTAANTLWFCQAETAGAAVWVPLTPDNVTHASGTPTVPVKGAATLSGTVTAANFPAVPAFNTVLSVRNTTASTITLTATGGATISKIDGTSAGTIDVPANSSIGFTTTAGTNAWAEY